METKQAKLICQKLQFSLESFINTPTFELLFLFRREEGNDVAASRQMELNIDIRAIHMNLKQKPDAFDI